MEATEDNSLGPTLGRVERIEVGLLDDHAEGLVKAMTRFVFFYADDVNASIDEIVFDDVGGDREVDSADVRFNREIRTAPRHHSAARFLTNDEISISGEV